MDNDQGELWLEVTVGWSTWAEPDQPGHPALLQALADLVAEGWGVSRESDFQLPP